jgi:hypothetical protein
MNLAEATRHSNRSTLEAAALCEQISGNTLDHTLPIRRKSVIIAGGSLT